MCALRVSAKTRAVRIGFGYTVMAAVSVLKASAEGMPASARVTMPIVAVSVENDSLDGIDVRARLHTTDAESTPNDSLEGIDVNDRVTGPAVAAIAPNDSEDGIGESARVRLPAVAVRVENDSDDGIEESG